VKDRELKYTLRAMSAASRGSVPKAPKASRRPRCAAPIRNLQQRSLYSVVGHKGMQVRAVASEPLLNVYEYDTLSEEQLGNLMQRPRIDFSSIIDTVRTLRVSSRQHCAGHVVEIFRLRIFYSLLDVLLLINH
jgi:hypothetical protein